MGDAGSYGCVKALNILDQVELEESNDNYDIHLLQQAMSVILPLTA